MDLVIEGLSKTYPNGVKALQGVTLTVKPGMFGLLGPNGAGKSSLMRTLATLQGADAGTVRLGDIDVLKEPERVRRTLGYLPQEFGLYPKVSAEVLLDHFAVLKGVVDGKARRELVHALLNQTNLWDARSRKVGTFSGGMKQRFGIAVALIGAPKLIIVDEPTAGLDPAERVRFLNLLAEIGESAVVLLSTHIVADVTDLCSRMAMLIGGKVVLEGEPLGAIERVAGRIWERAVPRAELAELEASHAVVSRRLVGGKMVVRVHAESAPGGFAPATPDLEDVYFTGLAGRL